MLWFAMIELARGGVAVGAAVGVDVPTDSSFDRGGGVGLLVGYRKDVAMVHLQPELMVRYTTATPAVQVAPGAAITVMSPVAVGLAAHLGLPSRAGPSWDLLGVLEITAIPKLRPGIRAGVRNIEVSTDTCDACEQASNLYGTIDAVLVMAF